MTVIDARKRVAERITSAMALHSIGQTEALGMTLSMLHYDLDDLETAARAEGEAEGRRKALAEWDVMIAQGELDRA